MSEIGI